MKLFKKNQKTMYKGTECVIRSEYFDKATNRRLFYLYPSGKMDMYYICELGQFELI